MCGIAGYLGGSSGRDPGDVLGSMARVIAHRGPDDSGVWFDQPDGVGLCHRRLAVLDTSETGRQPMESGSGRYQLIYNGEIYNHMQLRKELEREGPGTPWRGSSDTETLLTAIERWGLEEALVRSRGMFALALWDRLDKQLHLARDRFGEKPLYYGVQNGVLLFGSELKALRCHPAFDGEIDGDALHLYFRHGYVPAPYTIYSGIRKLLPGTLLQIDGRCTEDRNRLKPYPYWSLKQAVDRGGEKRFDGDEEQARTLLERNLRSVVRSQMLSDVDLGAFLSGGIDSSAIVALMQDEAHRPVKTFSIGFDDPQRDEASHARAVAAHLGTEHTELLVTSEQALAVVPDLPGLYDEPFSDSSQIPTALLARLSRGEVTVCLSGDGGDELFAGYDRYRFGNQILQGISFVPLMFRHGLARVAGSLPISFWNGVARPLSLLNPVFDGEGGGRQLVRLMQIAGGESREEIYRRLVSHWQRPQQLLRDGCEPSGLYNGWGSQGCADNIAWMMQLDSGTYLPDDILVKLDRAAMAASLETRTPFLDHTLFEFVWSLPMEMKYREGQSKWLLRQVLYNYVPAALVERPKMGFMPPIDHWLRGSLKDWAESLLTPSRLEREGFFRPEPILRMWREHLEGKANWQYQLWDVLMFQSWLEAEK